MCEKKAKIYVRRKKSESEKRGIETLITIMMMKEDHKS
jgi:hypothetical protein